MAEPDLRSLAKKGWTPGDPNCPICHQPDGFHDQTLHADRKKKS